MSDEVKLCPCGKPLHYSDPEVKRFVEKTILDMGEFMKVTVAGHTYRVSRHYIALHGLRAVEMPELGFEEVPFDE